MYGRGSDDLCWNRAGHLLYTAMGGGPNEQLHVWAGLGAEHNTRFGVPPHI